MVYFNLFLFRHLREMWRFPFSSKWKNSVSCCRKEPLILFFISPFRQRHGIAILEAFSDITVTEVAISSFEEQLTSLFLLLFFVENFGSGVKITGQDSGDVVVFFFHEVAPMESLPLFPPFTMGLKETVASETRYARSFFPQFAFIFCERGIVFRKLSF